MEQFQLKRWIKKRLEDKQEKKERMRKISEKKKKNCKS